MQNVIRVLGAKEHNLKNISVTIPRDQLVVITGLSGSGKSTLAFDTLYAEGQRRYVESLSSYARLFLGQMKKPEVDSIEGLSPAIAIDQKTTSQNPRSTVGTVTEIYDYLRLLYARCGEVRCPSCGRLIEQQSLDQIVDRIQAFPEGTRLWIMGPVARRKKGEFAREIQKMIKEGFVRARIDDELVELEDLPDDFKLEKNKRHTVEVVVDRLILKKEKQSRLADSLEVALRIGKGLVSVLYRLNPDQVDRQRREESEKNGVTSHSHDRFDEEGFLWTERLYSQNFSCPDCEIDIGEITPRLFSFNNPVGACPECHGLGELVEIDPALVISNPQISLNDGCIQAMGWNFADRKSWARGFIVALAQQYGFSLDTPWNQLSLAVRNLILYGNHGEKISVDTSYSKYNRGEDYETTWIGVVPSLMKRYQETNSDEMKALYQRYLSTKKCPSCGGARLRKEALSVKVQGLNIYELCSLSVAQLKPFLAGLKFPPQKNEIALPILRELNNRVGFLSDVGLTYLNLSRAAGTLSGGEAQRIRLATQIGSGLMGVIYILDEPSIGLHQKDNGRLIRTLEHLRDLGNTVIVVEHDEETILAANTVIDIGPGAGKAGGQLIACGSPEEVMACKDSITGAYLSGRKEIPVPEKRRPVGEQWLELQGCHEHNLKNIDVSIPLKVFTCVTGVSGSGKSSLVNGIVAQYLATKLNGSAQRACAVEAVRGDDYLDKLIVIDQSPIGRTPRSNPATYTGVFDEIRRLYAQTKEARARGYQPGRFSFNVKGGRCESCHGDGVKKIEMHFLPDVYVSCEVCHGERYNRETLEVLYKGKNISDVLKMTVDEALEFFSAVPAIARKLQTLQEVGLGYIELGQPSTLLSGGEAQRVKLASELSKRQTGKTFYILDEPTTGLHTADVHRLVDILQRLTENGNTVLVIEHQLDVIKQADYIIDLGPDGGDGGGQIVAKGTPEEVALVPESYTGQYIKEILTRDSMRRKDRIQHGEM